MRHHLFADSERFTTALLFKPTAFAKHELISHYIQPLQAAGINPADLIAFTLAYNEVGKAPVSLIKDYLAKLLPGLSELGVTVLYVTDSSYFKTLTKQAKAEPHIGYVLPCAVPGFEHMRVILGINYQSLIYNPGLQDKLDLSLKTLAQHLHGTYIEPGANIIHSATYPDTVEAIQHTLTQLHQHPVLACDIEAFSLRFWEAGIGSIAFAWDQHHGTAFFCDYRVKDTVDPDNRVYGEFVPNHTVRQLLREFFESYRGKLVFHNSTYDIKVLIYTLFMRDLLDTEGLLRGLEVMTRDFDDTKIIAYLAYNSTAGNNLSLKALAQEFAGNWVQDEIHNITRIEPKALLQYNLVDTLSTQYIRQRDYPTMVADNQETLYQGLMLDTARLLIQIELTGMPMNWAKIQEAKTALERQQQELLDTIATHPAVQSYNHTLQVKAMEAANAKLKTKQHPLEKFAGIVYNPNSGPQTQGLLYEHLSLPVIDVTDAKQPATGADTLKKLLNHTSDTSVQALLQALMDYSKVNKILTAFIPAFEQALLKTDGAHYLHGNFNIGGTVSGRLSSSKPNLQQIPSGSTFGKLIKSCFSAPKGWIFAGADFNSLEDYISALTTKDPNKLNVYIKGFDGHCLRAAYYFREKLPYIDLDDPASVNSIKKTHPELRQESKAPTFALTYQGTYHTLMTNLGWSEDKARSVEENYHKLYQVSDQYVQSRLAQASQDGYVDVAFGLRIRTPLLKQVIWGSSKIPYEAAAEGRTAGNALGQSYGLLNNRAAVEFMKKVWASPYRLDIKPVALIHDAIYLMIRDDLEVVAWVNKELIASMRWQELPEIQHDTVKLGAALDLFWPDWAHPITLPNDADAETIREICLKAKAELEGKAS